MFELGIGCGQTGKTQCWIWKRCEKCRENRQGERDLKEMGKLKYTGIMSKAMKKEVTYSQWIMIVWAGLERVLVH